MRMSAYALALFSTLTTATSQASVVLYNDSFDSLSAPSYSTVFGNVDIAEGPTGPLTSNSLAFNSADGSTSFGYDQVSYAVDRVGSPYEGADYDRYNLSFDLYTEDLLGSSNQFIVFLDTPSVRSLSFTGSGAINAFNPNSGLNGLGSYEDQELLNVVMNFDITANIWDIFINDVELYSAELNADSLKSVRFSHGSQAANQADLTATSYLDNVKITAVPEPATLGLLALGLAGVCFTRRSRSSKKIVISSSL